MSFPNLTDLAATSMANYQSQLADNVTSHNALLLALKKSGQVQITGGDPIYEQFMFAENGNGGSYSGYDPLPTGAQDVISGAQFSLAQYAVPVTFNGREQLINAGKQEVIDLIDGRMQVAEATMSNLLNRHLYLDGTGNNGKNITGLAAAVTASPSTGVYGGIDRSVASNAFWRNKYWGATASGGAVATAATIQTQWNNFIIQLTRGTDRPDMVIAGPSVFALFESSLQAMQHIYSEEDASAGFKTVAYQGIKVTFDTAASGISTNYAYFLNSKYLKFRSHKDRNFVRLDTKNSFNQDASVNTFVWAGNLTCAGAQFQGLFNNV
jgi:hypothetical protein